MYKKNGFAVMLFLLSSMSLVAGVNGTWSSTVSGNWSDANNWKDGIIPFGSGQSAIFDVPDVSVTNDAAMAVGVLRYNQNGVKMYGNPLVLDATAPTIILNSGIIHLHSPVIASNGLTFTKESFTDTRAHLYQRNEIGQRGLLVDFTRIKPHGEHLEPLPGDGNVINSVLATNSVAMTLARDGRYNQIGSPNGNTIRVFPPST